MKEKIFKEEKMKEKMGENKMIGMALVMVIASTMAIK